MCKIWTVVYPHTFKIMDFYSSYVRCGGICWKHSVHLPDVFTLMHPDFCRRWETRMVIMHRILLHIAFGFGTM